ncbi:MAG: chorismate lyase [Gammaproteobacteria bacterium]|nr:chorismate lyase [Gammaproteobacteria bacterium]
MIVPDITDPSFGWKSCSQFFPQPPSEWRRWLLDPRSLTQILVRHSQGDFAVKLVEESWWQGKSPYLSRLLGDRLSSQRMWSRKVVLQGKGIPWVIAHTLVPQESLRGKLAQVKKLETKPLGAFLFSHSNLCRGKLDIVSTAAGWGRCSLFLLDWQPILVAEFFLPALISRNAKPFSNTLSNAQ